MSKSNRNTSLTLLRGLGLVEGISLLTLLFIAMPAKYVFHQPWLVQKVGMAHGILFVLFVMAIIVTAILNKISLANVAKLLISSVVPFGTFYVDRKILKPMQQRQDESSLEV